MLLCWNWYTNC